ncbi:hypothetical protein [Ruegeria sp. AU67]|uniref:hypothetical protein n=1 Tax=Ruegeria sp. AU67 TaxID=2108530 RepID=UPI00135BD11F|nr:hypothetical protein [Ruegeria sp. AU67]
MQDVEETDRFLTCATVGVVEFDKGEPASFHPTAVGWPDKKGMISARWVNECALDLLWCEAEIHPQVGVLLKKLVIPERCTLTAELSVDFAYLSFTQPTHSGAVSAAGTLAKSAPSQQPTPASVCTPLRP